MKSASYLRQYASIGAIVAAAFAFSAAAQAAGPEVVSGPGADPECFKPQSADTKYFQWPAKPGPYRIALVNGFIANDWRVQMIRVAKAYAEQPSVKGDIKEFKVISVGEDIAAQIAAVKQLHRSGLRRRHRQRQQHGGLRRPSSRRRTKRASSCSPSTTSSTIR